MKRLILIMIAVLTASAFGYRLPVAWSVGGGISTDSVRVTAYIQRTSTPFSVITAKDTTFTSTGTNGVGHVWVDSLGQYTVRYLLFSSPDTFREMTYGIVPVEFQQYTRSQLVTANAGIAVVLDTLDDQVWATAGTVTLDSADIADIAAEVVAGIGSEAGTGINAVTLYARDTINSVFVPGVYLTATAGAELLSATTGVNGYATFNCNSATYTFSALGSPYTWVPFSRAVAGNITDTITGGGVTVIASAEPGLATIYGVIDRNGSPVSGVAVNIVLTRPDTLTIDSAFIDFNHTVYSNASGVWQDDVYYLAGDTRNFYYTVSFTVAGQKRTIYCRPTASGSHIVNSILIEKP